MLGRPSGVDITLSVLAASATIVLATVGLIRTEDISWIWIVAVVVSSFFLLIHAAVSSFRDKGIVRSLGQNYDQVQQRTLRIISELGELSTYDLWMIDIYLPIRKYRIVKTLPFIERKRWLSRQLSVSLIDALRQPPCVEPSSGPYGECFEEAKPLLWFDQDLHGPYPENAQITFYSNANFDLPSTYGLVCVFPLVDHLNKNCSGVLVIHVKPELEVVFKTLVVLKSQQGCHRINNACIDIHRLLDK